MSTTGGDLAAIVNATGRSITEETLYPERHLAKVVGKVWLPCILLLGGFGNIATVCVMSRIKDRNSSYHVFLIALALCDLTCLYVGPFSTLLLDFFGFNITTVNSVTCKLSPWLRYSTNTMSAWMLTAVTVQRTMAITWPHKIRVICTTRRAWTVAAAVVFAALALHSHCLVMLELSETRQCVAKSVEFWFFYQNILVWMNLCTASFVPFAILLVCDVILSLSLFQASSITAALTTGATSNVQAVGSSDSRKETAWKTSVMILVISSLFLVLTMPLCIVLVWYNLNVATISQEPRLLARAQLIHSVTLLLFNTNNAVNFILYCLTGTRFRRVFIDWICCGRQSCSSESNSNTTPVSVLKEGTK